MNTSPGSYLRRVRGLAVLAGGFCGRLWCWRWCGLAKGRFRTVGHAAIRSLAPVAKRRTCKIRCRLRGLLGTAGFSLCGTRRRDGVARDFCSWAFGKLGEFEKWSPFRFARPLVEFWSMKAKDIQELVSELAGPVTSAHPPRLLPLLARHVEEVNSEAVNIFPEEVRLLEAILTIIDQEPNDERAWAMVHDHEETRIYEQPAELTQIVRAVGKDLSLCTMAYINLRDGTGASGVLVEIEGRLFVATTAHSIPSNPAGELSFIGSVPTPATENIPPIRNYKRGNSYECDVAYIELDRSFADERFGKRPIPLSRIKPVGTGHPTHWTMVCGFPTSEIRTIHDARTREATQLFTSQAWSNNILPPENWGAVPRSREMRPPHPDFDVIIPYNRDDEIVSCGQIHSSANLSDPHGMSGGGVWQPIVPTNSALWTVERYCLIAIQSGWPEQSRYLQSTQIIHWLRLLWNHQPELRPVLSHEFPQLTST